MKTRKPDQMDALYSGSVRTDDGYPVKLWQTESFLAGMATTAEKAFAAEYGGADLSYPGQVYDKWVQEGTVRTDDTDVGMKKYYLSPTISDEGAKKEAEAADYFMSNAQKVMMADSDETFEKEQDAIIAKFIELGIEDTWKEIQEVHQIGFEKYEELFGDK